MQLIGENYIHSNFQESGTKYRSLAGNVQRDQDQADPHAKPSRSDARLTLGTITWVIVISTLPIHKLITSFTGLYTYLVLGLIVALFAFGKFARPAGAAIWAACVPFIVIASILSGIYSSVSRSLLVGLQLAIVVGLAPFVLRYYVNKSEKFTKYALAGFVTVQTLSSIAGLVQLTGAPVFGMVANSGRANGLATHPNILGLMAALAILICLTTTFKTQGRIRFLVVCTVGVNFAALIGSGSLSSLLSFAGGTAVLLVASRATFRTIAIAAVASVALAAGGAIIGLEYSILTETVEGRVNTVTGVSNDGVASVSIRQATYAFAMESIQNDPLSGVGMDSANQGTYNGTTVVHNYLLRSWYQGGILLFISLALITGFLAYRVIKAIAKGIDALPAAVVTTIIIFALTSAFYTQQQYWLPIMLAVAHLITAPSKLHVGASER
ncbi:O-antigen ligase family protein [Rhodococcus pyridinivorans]|uniref:O-antigen ligase family protein n=1 Tax=Rhodococcus pyridinivorans TaxID=103816 RepID=UPI001E5DB970|nr:O-antigen ligase family protein [Rhodococcus pyridinivorans]UGQ59059.1 O-antigen ligase family protein [Rhodococcus pyridinivorans]